MWGSCVCNHGPANNTHFWDTRKHRHTFCEACVVCGRKERDHNPFGHDYQRCGCLEYQETA